MELSASFEKIIEGNSGFRWVVVRVGPSTQFPPFLDVCSSLCVMQMSQSEEIYGAAECDWDVHLTGDFMGYDGDFKPSQGLQTPVVGGVRTFVGKGVRRFE